MSVNFDVYVGPYLVTDKAFDWYEWDSVVFSARDEMGDDELTLLPNVKLPGVERQTSFDKFSETPVVEINQIEAEKKAFAELTKEMCDGLAWHVIRWGVVPYFS